MTGAVDRDPGDDGESGDDGLLASDQRVAELLAMIEQLDEDNERLRLRVLEVMEWTEEAVTAQVAVERQMAASEERAAALAAELDAIRATRSWRLLAPPRRVYGWIRGRLAGRGA